MPNQFTEITKTIRQWCIENNITWILDMWDYNLNSKTPDEISWSSKQIVYFSCGNPLHSSRALSINAITSNGGKKYIPERICIGCNSFAELINEKYGEGYIEKIWSNKNTMNPYEISSGSGKKVWLKCLKDDSHPDYELSCSNGKKTINCPYCVGKKICETNNLAHMFPKSKLIWSDKNQKTPEGYSPASHANVWWKCENSIHKDFKRKISNATAFSNFSCPECIKSSHYRMEDLSGQRFNFLTVIELDEESTARGNGTYWFCNCDCGTKHKSILSEHLKSGKTQSCGCLWFEEKQRASKAYVGTKTTKARKERRSPEYLKWRNDIIIKDNYTCQCCGKYGGKLNVHHINNYKDNPDLRYDINNGITLCIACHGIPIKGSFHNIYGTRSNTLEQLEEYINNKRNELNFNIPFTVQDYINGKILSSQDVIK